MIFALASRGWLTRRLPPLDFPGREMFPTVRSRDVTLLDVLDMVREAAAHEPEIVATVVHLVHGAQMRLSDDAVRAMMDRSATVGAGA